MHATDVDAAPAAVWDTQIAACPGPRASGLLRAWAVAVGAEPAAANGLASHVIGAERPGLVVREVVPPATWAAAGRHRFARYQVVFRIEPTVSGASRLSAETYASFPGRGGSAWRRIVMDFGLHALAMRAVLAWLRRRAEQRRPAPGDRV